MCHGDLSTTCRRDYLGQISEIEMFWNGTQGVNKLHGMRIKQKEIHNNFYNSYSGSTIEAGLVDIEGDRRYNYTSFGSNFQFFGFKTTSREGQIVSLQIVTFDQESFASSKLNTRAEFSVPNQANANWHAEVASILANREIGRLPVPGSLANVGGVYRPEQLRIDEAEVRQLLREFDEDKREDEAIDAQLQEQWANIQAADNVYYKEYVEAERVATLAQVLDIHAEETEDVNRGITIAVIIGGVVLVLLLGAVLYMCMKTRGGNSTQGQQRQRIVVGNSSGAHSNKLDDIM